MQTLDPYRAPDRLIAEQLHRAPVFADLPVEHRDCLALLREGAFFVVPAGVDVVAPGDPSALIVVIDGALSDARGVRSWRTGTHFGIAETLAEHPFATAIGSVAPTLLFRLDAAALHGLLATCPIIARRLLDGVAPSATPRIAAAVPARSEVFASPTRHQQGDRP